MLVIGTYKQWAVGEHVVAQVTDPQGVAHALAFVVLAEATEADYRRCCRELGSDNDTPFLAPARFYQIATD